MEEAQYEQLVSLPNAKSKVWKYFGFPGDSKGKIIDNKKVYCKLCEPAVAISYSDTSNLTYHFLKRHLEEHRKVMEVKDREHQGLQQATLQEAIASAVPYAKDSKQARHLVSATADFIWQGLQPISVVDELSFRTLLTIADPKFQLPHRTYFSTKISSHQQRSYVSLTVHFIDADFMLATCCMLEDT